MTCLSLHRIPTSLRLFLVAAVVIFAAIAVRQLAVKQRAQKNASHPGHENSKTESPALHIAKSALDQSIETLTGDPDWRDGFDKTALGVVDVELFDGADDGRGVYDPSVPQGCVRIVATASSGDDTVSVEGFWFKRADPFTHALLSGNEIRIGPCEENGSVVIGNIFNNAINGGSIELSGGATVYGNTTCVGRISIGATESPSTAVVYGRAAAAEIIIEDTGEIRDYEDLSEAEAGFDLDFDGEINNQYVSKTQGSLTATRSAVSSGVPLMDGDTDYRVGGGSNPVHVGGPVPGILAHPLPDFAVYYQLTTGSTTYPPSSDHVTTSIAGDGDGHYFASAGAFVAWVHRCYPVEVVCWRCAGDSRIDPDDATRCPGCFATGRQPAIEITGVFYIDDDVLDLSDVGTNLIVHGTIVVAQGDPGTWPRRSIGGMGSVDHFPDAGALIIGGPKRMHFTQTYRSSHEGASYLRYRRALRSGGDRQQIPFPAPDLGRPLREFPGVLAATRIDIKTRGVGFARHRADIGEESLSILQGIVFAGDVVRFDGRGGWAGDPVVFDEELARSDDDSFDESVLDIDLNDDGDRFDIVATIDITACPVIPLSYGRANVDINNDGVLGSVVLGSSYAEFFEENGYALPVLMYHEGVVITQAIEITGSCTVTHDPGIAGSTMPMGFDVDSATRPQGLATWRTIPQR